MNNIIIKKNVEGRKPVWVIGAETLMIDLYRDHEHLWNFRHKDYYDRNLREKSLQQISRQLGHDYRGVPYSPREIKEKLKNMRATFGRELKKQCNKKRSSNGTYKPGWKHFHRMQFLRVARVPRKNKDIMDKTIITDQESEYEECIIDNEDEHLDMYCEVEVEPHDFQDGMSDTQVLETITEEDAKPMELTTMMKTEETNVEETVEPTTRPQQFKVVRKGNCYTFEPKSRLRKMITSSSANTKDDNNTSNANIRITNALGSSSAHIDGEFHFCMSLAENLRKMNAFNREMAKVEIQKVMIKFMFPYAETEPS